MNPSLRLNLCFENRNFTFNKFSYSIWIRKINWAKVVRGNSKLNETQTNILNVVGNEQNQKRRN